MMELLIRSLCSGQELYRIVSLRLRVDLLPGVAGSGILFPLFKDAFLVRGYKSIAVPLPDLLEPALGSMGVESLCDTVVLLNEPLQLKGRVKFVFLIWPQTLISSCSSILPDRVRPWLARSEFSSSSGR
jgi:hypothetical protein